MPSALTWPGTSSGGASRWNPRRCCTGMRDVLSGQKLLMTDEDLRDTLRAVQAGERQKADPGPGRTASVADETWPKGPHSWPRTRPIKGVVCLPSGLQYKILKAGNGPKPTATDTVECHFRGTLIDGRQFAGTDPTAAPAPLR